MADDLYIWRTVLCKASVDHDPDEDPSQSRNFTDQLSACMGSNTFMSDSILFLEKKEKNEDGMISYLQNPNCV